MQQYRDATGEYDYGNIDEFYIEDDSYHLSGDWGTETFCQQNPN